MTQTSGASQVQGEPLLTLPGPWVSHTVSQGTIFRLKNCKPQFLPPVLIEGLASLWSPREVLWEDRAVLRCTRSGFSDFNLDLHHFRPGSYFWSSLTRASTNISIPELGTAPGKLLLPSSFSPGHPCLLPLDGGKDKVLWRTGSPPGPSYCKCKIWLRISTYRERKRLRFVMLPGIMTNWN